MTAESENQKKRGINVSGTVSRRTLMGTALATTLAVPGFGRKANAAQPIRLGCLTDLNGPYSDLTGKGTVTSAKLAIEDFAKLHPDIPVELLVADFQLKPDVGLSVLRSWLDNDGVDAVLDVPMSALALASVTVLQEKNKVGLMTSPATTDLTRETCGPNHILFSPGTYCLAATMVKAVIQNGGDSWFFILPDYTMGKSMVADAERVVTQSGGKVVGKVAHPFPGTTDFSSYLLRAQSSGAKVICIANAGEDALNTVKQAHEFGMTGKGLTLVVPFFGDTTVHAAGLEISQGSYYPTSFYWDRNDGTRDYAQRLKALVPDRVANKECANAYSGTLHYLKAVALLGIGPAKASGRAVIERMKSIRMEDPLFGSCAIREDGQALRDMLLLQVKKPANSHSEWDLSTIISTLPPDGLYHPLTEARCKVARS